MQHADEYRRCLIEADVRGIMRVWEHTAPHLARMAPSDAFLALHIARVEAQTIPKPLQDYSLKLLEERGIERHDGKWSKGLPVKQVIAETVGIASISQDRALSKKIVRAMTDALLNGLEKGITEPLRQRELMMKARARIKTITKAA